MQKTGEHLMALSGILEKRRKDIMERWFESIIETYPDDTARFLRNQQSRFRNPVGHTIAEGMEEILSGIISGEDTQTLSPFLDKIIRIRAVQDFTPSQALFFMMDLKRVIREALVTETNAGISPSEMTSLDSRIDDLLLLAFDIFMQCREKIYDLKANEVRRMTFRMIERINRMPGEPESGSEGKEIQSDTNTKGEVAP